MTEKYNLPATNININCVCNSDDIEYHNTELKYDRILARWRKKLKKALPMRPFANKERYNAKINRMVKQYAMYKAGRTMSTQIAKVFGVSRSTLFRDIKVCERIL